MAKLGLALSGGGFRASLFHIGVLARLAELDLLRSVEVLSCVSGGSIIGAFYYLKLKRLLESTPEAKIKGSDYVNLVRQIEEEFLSGVQRNLRVRAFSNFWKNLRMIAEGYSRSDRMAELYDRHFFDMVADHPTISLRELKIQPPDAPASFHPRLHNRKRKAKIPMLIINATTLNTGRNWQFTAVDLGEREPDVKFGSFEKNSVLPAFRYDAPTLPAEKYRKVPLSIAVAASACVPGIFQPLALTDLYPEVVPQLVDGGVEDNQGISAILYEKCTHVIASDASTQLVDLDRPSAGIVGVVTRTNGVLMDRVRDQGLESLVLHEEGGTVDRTCIVHLREDLEPGYQQPDKSNTVLSDEPQGRTSYGIDKRIQRELARVRTDLDSFTDIEAYSLMFSGYRIATHTLQKEFLRPFSRSAPGKAKRQSRPQQHAGWKFSAVKTLMEEGGDEGYRTQLRIAQNVLFKAYHSNRWLILVGLLIVLVSLAVPTVPLCIVWMSLGGGFWSLVGWSAAITLFTLILTSIPGLSSRRHRWWRLLLKCIVMASTALFGSLLFYLHLRVIDPIFIRKGKVRVPGM